MRLTKQLVYDIVNETLHKLPSNPLALEVAPNGVRKVHDRWWVVLAPQNEPEHRHIAWEQAAIIEEFLDDEQERTNGKISVTIA